MVLLFLSLYLLWIIQKIYLFSFCMRIFVLFRFWILFGLYHIIIYYILFYYYIISYYYLIIILFGYYLDCIILLSCIAKRKIARKKQIQQDSVVSIPQRVYIAIKLQIIDVHVYNIVLLYTCTVSSIINQPYSEFSTLLKTSTTLRIAHRSRFDNQGPCV